MTDIWNLVTGKTGVLKDQDIRFSKRGSKASQVDNKQNPCKKNSNVEYQEFIKSQKIKKKIKSQMKDYTSIS